MQYKLYLHRIKKNKLLMDLINWVDKKIDEIKEIKDFNKFFSDIKINAIGYENYLFNPEKGIDIVMSDSMIVHSIHLFSGNTPESKKFQGIVINNLSFEMNSSDVAILLGEPNKKGGGYKDIFGSVPRWNKYYFDTYTLHLQYSHTTDEIDIITIGSLKLEPYLNSALQ